MSTIDPIVGLLCQICGETTSKYKCSACNLKYCSVKCFKVHRSTHHGNSEREASVSLSQPKKDRPIIRPVGEGKNSIPQEMRDLLARHHNLKRRLNSIYSSSLKTPRSKDDSISGEGHDEVLINNIQATEESPDYNAARRNIRKLRAESNSEAQGLQELSDIVSRLFESPAINRTTTGTTTMVETPKIPSP